MAKYTNHLGNEFPSRMVICTYYKQQESKYSTISEMYEHWNIDKSKFHFDRKRGLSLKDALTNAVTSK